MTRSKLLFTLATLFAAAAPAPAVDYLFVQPTTGTAANWSTASWIAGPPTTPGAAGNTITLGTLAGSTSSFTLTNDVGSITAAGLRFGNFGTGTFTQAMAANVLTLDGTTPYIINNGVVTATLSGTGGISLANTTATTFGGTGNAGLTISAPLSTLSGTSPIIISQTGNGLVSLTGVNTFTGGLGLNAGVLSVSAETGLGNTGNVVTFGGGVFRPTSAITTSTRNFVVGAGGGTVAGTVAYTTTGTLSGSGPLAKLESSVLTLGSANASYTGAVTLGALGPVVLGTTLATTSSTAGGITLNNAGTLGSASAITINNSAVLTVTRGTSLPTVADRFGTVPIISNGGGLTYSPGAAAPESAGTLGTFTMNGGLTTLRSAAVAGNASGTLLYFGNLTRNDNATLLLGGTLTGNGQIGGPVAATTLNLTFANVADSGGVAGTTTRGVVPWAARAVDTASSFANGLVTYETGTGFRALSASEVAAGLTADSNSGLALTNAMTGNLSVLALQGTSALASYTISGGFTLTVATGAVQSYNPFTIANTTVAFPTGVTGYFHQGDNVTFSGTSNITGDSGVVFSSHSTTAYRGIFSAPNSFTGGLFLNGRYTATGTATAGATFTDNNQLGAAGEKLVLNGGALNFTNTTTDTSFGTRPVVLNGPGVVTVATAARTLTIPGTISGPGSLVVNGAGTVALTNASANTYSGGTHQTGGTFLVAAANQLGTGPVFLSGGTFRAAGNLNFTGAASPSELIASAAVAFDTQANSVTIDKPLSSVGNPVFTKSGTGSLTVTSASPKFSGTVAVSAGSLTISGANGALPLASAVNLATNTTLTIDNTAGYNGDRIGDLSAVSMAGARVSYIGANTATSDPAERIGVLSNTASGGVFSVTGGSASPTVLRFGALNATAALTLRGTDLGGTSGNYTRIIFDSLLANVSVLPNVFFADTPGTGTSTSAAGYDTVRGVILFTPVPTSGTSINNFAPDNVPVAAAYTTTGDATAATGAQIYTLTLDAGTTLTLNGGNAASGTNGNTPDGTLSIAGGLLTSQNGPKTITSPAASAVAFGASVSTITTTSNLTFDTNVTLSGSGAMTKAGAGTLTLNGPFAVTGNMTVSDGSLVLGTAVTLANLSGAGSVNSGANGLTLNSTVPTTFSGGLTAASLTKTGAATLTLSPASAVSVAGATTVSGGVLVVGNANAAPVLSNYALNGGTIDAFGNTIAALPTVTGTANGVTNSNPATASTFALSYAADTAAGFAISGNVIATKTGAGALTLTGTGNATPVPAVAGTLNINEGTVTVTAAGAGIGTGTKINVAAGATFRLNGTGVNNSTNPWGAVTLTNGNWINNGTNFFDPYFASLTFADGGTITSVAIGSPYYHVTSAAGISSLASANPAVITLTATTDRIINDSAVTMPITVAAGSVPSGIDLDVNAAFIGGTTTSFNKLGAGVLRLGTLSASSTYSMTVTAGTLRVDATANLGTAAFALAGGTLQYGGTAADTFAKAVAVTGSSGIDVLDPAATLTASGVYSGAGSLTKSGPGTLALTAANTYTGSTTVAAGTLSLTGSGSFAASPTVTVGAGATLDVAGLTGGANYNGTQFALAANQGLRGAGTVLGAVTVPATTVLTGGAGLSTETLTFTNTLTFEGSNTLRVAVGSAAASKVDVGANQIVSAGGALTTVTLFTDGTLPLDGTTVYTYTFLVSSNATQPTLSQFTLNPNPENFVFVGTPGMQLSGSNIEVTFVAAPVPEPATVLAVAAVGLGLGRVVRRRLKK